MTLRKRGLELYSAKAAFNPFSDNVGETGSLRKSPGNLAVRGKPAELKASRQFPQSKLTT